MDQLRNANLHLQPDKCEFLRHRDAYLAHRTDSQGVRFNPEEIQAVSEFPIPKKEKNIKQFLGLGGCYRRFINWFSKIASPKYKNTNIKIQESGRKDSLITSTGSVQ